MKDVKFTNSLYFKETRRHLLFKDNIKVYRHYNFVAKILSFFGRDIVKYQAEDSKVYYLDGNSMRLAVKSEDKSLNKVINLFKEKVLPPKKQEPVVIKKEPLFDVKTIASTGKKMVAALDVSEDLEIQGKENSENPKELAVFHLTKYQVIDYEYKAADLENYIEWTEKAINSYVDDERYVDSFIHIGEKLIPSEMLFNFCKKDLEYKIEQLEGPVLVVDTYDDFIGEFTKENQQPLRVLLNRMQALALKEIIDEKDINLWTVKVDAEAMKIYKQALPALLVIEKK